MSEQAAAADKDGPKKKKKPIVLILLVALLVLGGGGGAGAYFYLKRGSTPAPPPPPDPGILALDSFVVNLADPGGQRFVRVTLRLVLEDKEHAEELKEDELPRARARSAILEVLAQQTAAHLVTPQGKDELKKLIAERVSHALEHEHAKVIDVLFTEFVVQF
jgi:flagellar protein FliL